MEKKRQFFLEVFPAIFRHWPEKWPCLVGTAQAAVETGWGASRCYTLHGNLFGIKPVGAQPASGQIRTFRNPSASIRAWVYLVRGSSHYSQQRRWRERDLRDATTEEEVQWAWEKWVQDMAPIYAPPHDAPTNAAYPMHVKSIMRELEEHYNEVYGDNCPCCLRPAVSGPARLHDAG